MKNLTQKIKLLTLSLMLMFTWQSAMADQDPVAMLEQASQQMISALKSNRAKIKQNSSYVETLSRRIILPKVDLGVMVRLALGRDGWQGASVGEREQFTEAFTSLLVRTYAAALAAYTDETVQFMPLRGSIAGKKRIQVESIIHQRGGPQIPVTYRLLLRKGQWRIYDLTVDGVSMIQSFKSQFSSYLTRGGMPELLQAMEKQRRANS